MPVARLPDGQPGLWAVFLINGVWLVVLLKVGSGHRKRATSDSRRKQRRIASGIPARGARISSSAPGLRSTVLDLDRQRRGARGGPAGGSTMARGSSSNSPDLATLQPQCRAGRIHRGHV